MDERMRAEHALPEPFGPGASPLLPRHLVDLFLRPRAFFSGQLAFGHTPYALLVAWCYGAAQSIDQIEQNLLRAQLGNASPGWDQMAPYITGSWSGFWLFLLVSGALSGWLIWWLGGWWYALRLRWSGAVAPDRRMARLVMVYSAFVQSGPIVLATLIYTLVFSSYGAAFEAEESLSVVLLVFPFWSIVTSYTGARVVFGLDGWAVRAWFLILPVSLYVFVFGGLMALLLLTSQNPA